MLDQSFSAENFRIILDVENRKGVHVEDKLSLTVIKKINHKIRVCNEAIKRYKRIRDFDAVNRFINKKKELRKIRDDELDKELSNVSKIISDKKFEVDINKINIPSGKPIYTIPYKPEHFFAIKQLQRNISRLFGVKQSNRVAIVEQVKTLLNDQFPKILIRTDIKSFYESIPLAPLIEKFNNENLLTPYSRKILLDVLNKYKKLAGSENGVPRGIGISAYLAELFMRDVDSEIKNLPDVTYYARYVDDMMVVFTPNPASNKIDYLKLLKEKVENKFSISLNPVKTNVYDLQNITTQLIINYLGYQFICDGLTVKVKLTDKKYQTYKERLKKSFDHYINYSKVDEKKARKLLVKRIRFLTGNTKLINNKNNILVGVYYSNSHLTDLDDIKNLDISLTSHINSKIHSPHLQNRLNKYKFLVGFVSKRFSSYSTQEFSDIVKIWK